MHPRTSLCTPFVRIYLPSLVTPIGCRRRPSSLSHLFKFDSDLGHRFRFKVSHSFYFILIHWPRKLLAKVPVASNHVVFGQDGFDFRRHRGDFRCLHGQLQRSGKFRSWTLWSTFCSSSVVFCGSSASSVSVSMSSPPPGIFFFFSPPISLFSPITSFASSG